MAFLTRPDRSGIMFYVEMYVSTGSDQKRKERPMKLKYSFETMALDDQIVAVPIGTGPEGFHGVIKLNESALEIFNLLKEETTEEAVAAALRSRYGDNPEIPGYVADMVKYLAGEGVLE